MRLYNIMIKGFPVRKQFLGLSAAQHYANAKPVGKVGIGAASHYNMWRTEGIKFFVYRENETTIIAECTEIEPELG
jgi:hypothetical protein